MATFPRLKTGAVMQYPAERAMAFRNEVLRFVDGSEQLYRDGGAPLRRWAVRLDLLDEGEAAEVEAFFAENRGAYSTFAFTDPYDGREYPKCSVQEDSLEVEATDALRAKTALTIREEL